MVGEREDFFAGSDPPDGGFVAFVHSQQCAIRTESESVDGMLVMDEGGLGLSV